MRIFLRSLLCALFFVSALMPICASSTYTNEEYGFAIDIPDGFQDKPMENNINLKLMSNGAITLQIRHLSTNDKLHGGSFAEAEEEEIEQYIELQQLFNALTTPQFELLTKDQDRTKNKLSYLWLLFAATTQIEKHTFVTSMLKYFFLEGDRIVEFVFIAPDEVMRKEGKMIDGMINTLRFLPKKRKTTPQPVLKTRKVKVKE